MLDADERAFFRHLASPAKIQDYLNTLSQNHEHTGHTLRSPRTIIRSGNAHCIEGALLAAAVLWYHGEPPLLLDLQSAHRDEDHVVALFRRFGHWGAISKTNHAVLRYREPVYETIHELVLSYFHEYFLQNGAKTLRNYSDPYDLSKHEDPAWLTAPGNLWYLARHLNDQPHYSVVSRAMIASFRKADPIELRAGKLVEWKAPAKSTSG